MKLNNSILVKLEMEDILLFNSKLYNDMTEVQKMDKMGRELLNNVILYINKKEHRICEIEFYLKNDKHNDPFVHGNDDQKTPLKWYFHKQNNTYKSGTYKGLDITFGYNDSYGGCLIRSIKPKDKDIIEGPCKVVDYILEQNKINSIESFVGNSGLLSVINCDKLYLKYDSTHFADMTIFLGPRVGLTLKKKGGDREKFIMKDYRYLIYPESINKYRSTIVARLVKNNNSDEQIKKLVKIPLNSIKKYKDIYLEKTFNEDNFYKNLKADDLLHMYYKFGN